MQTVWGPCEHLVLGRVLPSCAQALPIVARYRRTAVPIVIHLQPVSSPLESREVGERTPLQRGFMDDPLRHTSGNLEHEDVRIC